MPASQPDDSHELKRFFTQDPFADEKKLGTMSVISAKVIAGCFALSAFAVAILAGLASENPTAQILQRAVISMFVCYPVGLIVGMVCERVIVTHVGEHQRSNPVPDQANDVTHTTKQTTNDEQTIVV